MSVQKENLYLRFVSLVLLVLLLPRVANHEILKPGAWTACCTNCVSLDFCMTDLNDHV